MYIYVCVSVGGWVGVEAGGVFNAVFPILATLTHLGEQVGPVPASAGAPRRWQDLHGRHLCGQISMEADVAVKVSSLGSPSSMAHPE
jgi:hypothetical protein